MADRSGSTGPGGGGTKLGVMLRDWIYLQLLSSLNPERVARLAGPLKKPPDLAQAPNKTIFS